MVEILKLEDKHMKEKAKHEKRVREYKVMESKLNGISDGISIYYKLVVAPLVAAAAIGCEDDK